MILQQLLERGIKKDVGYLRRPMNIILVTQN